MEVKEKGCVYFFRHIGLSPVKIGYSTNQSPINRFSQFKTYAPYGSEILGFIQTFEAKDLESKLHLKYSSRRINGEWFEITEEDVKKEVDFYSNIEDIRDRNDFQIAWANHLVKNKNKVISILDKMTIEKSIKLRFMEFYETSNFKVNKSKVAKELGVTRQTIHLWSKEFKMLQ